MVFVLVWLSSLRVIISASIQVAANGILSFLWLSNIPLCVCVSICFIHSSVDGHLFPCLGYCKQCSHEYCGACIVSNSRSLLKATFKPCKNAVSFLGPGRSWGASEATDTPSASFRLGSLSKGGEWIWCHHWKHVVWSSDVLDQVLTVHCLTEVGCWSKSLTSGCLRFAFCKKKDKVTYLVWLFWRLNELIYVMLTYRTAIMYDSGWRWVSAEWMLGEAAVFSSPCQWVAEEAVLLPREASQCPDFLHLWRSCSFSEEPPCPSSLK